MAKKKPVKSNLSPKQQRFVQEYLVDLNGTKAAIRAGYSKKTADVQAAQLLAKLKVQEEVTKGKAELASKTEITKEWIVNGLVQNYNRAMQAEAVTDREGNPTGEYTYSGAVANKSLELLGRLHGYFIEKHEHNLPQGAIPIRIIEAVKPKKDA